jgi:L-asparagine transporter-like permease
MSATVESPVPPAAQVAAGPPGHELQRSLRSRHVQMISIGGIIGAGLFVGSSAAIKAAGPAILLSYLLAGAVILMVMRMLSEMAAATPGLGSFAEYVRLGLGDWGGFLSGWLYWYFWVVVVAIEAIAGAKILSAWIALPVWEIVAILMVLLTAVNLMSSRSYGEFEFWFSSIKVAAIIIFIMIAGAYAFGLTSGTGSTFSNLYEHGGFMPFGGLAVLAGVTTVVFSLCGAEIATIAAAESNESTRVISRMTINIVARILLFYVLSILMVLAVVPWTEIVSGESPFAAALTRTHIAGAATIMNLIVLTAVLSCLNSGVYVTSRVLFTLAARREAPQSLIALSKRRVPARAILIGSSFGYLAVLLSIVSPERVFAYLVNASGALMVVIYLLACFAHLRLRRQMERTSPERLTIKVWFFPWLTYVTIAAMIGVLIAMTLTAIRSGQFWTSEVVASGVAVLAAAVAAWIVQRRRRVTAGAVQTA